MSNPTVDTKMTVSEIGQKLRQAREKRSLTIEQAQKETHIHAKVLSAIEDGKCDEMLAPNYVKSFLKEYSAYLGLDREEIVGEYLKLHPELKGKAFGIKSAGGQDGKPGMKLSDVIRALRNAAVLFLIMFLVVFLGLKAAKYFNRPGQSKITPQSKAAKTAAAKTAKKASSAPKTQTAKNAPFTLTIKVKNPVMVRLKKDGVLLFNRVLPKGSEESFAVNNSVRIVVGRAELLEIFINGKSYGSPGRGVIRDLEITSNGVKVK